MTRTSSNLGSEVWAGVQSLLDDYAAVRTSDTVMLLYTSDSYEAAVWISAALELRDVPVRRVWMAPLVDPGFPVRLAERLPTPDHLSGRLVVITLERDTLSHGRTLRDVLAVYGRDRWLMLRAISVCPQLFSTALRVAPQDLSDRNTALLERLRPASRLHITTSSGTDLRVTLDPRHRWISNRGTAQPGTVLILPAGEIATYPAEIDGVFVADFAFNVNAITDLDARLGTRPVTVTIEGGQAKRFDCPDDEITELLELCFSRQNARRVGELGFGTNSAIRGPIEMNSHINERCPGVHLGFGQHNQDLAVVSYQAAIHLDLIARGGTVRTDFASESVQLENLPAPTGAHPNGLLHQDVSSACETDLDVDDCCGVIRGGDLQPIERSAFNHLGTEKRNAHDLDTMGHHSLQVAE
jgi:hypothetical protein